ncbi:MAG TPA: TlpA disulfide reductase family protein [Candidatus Sulfopaludibacter sp.]|jgi:peroxiredoxin|nr:TlpA disulfide reductase family protein [Candidatus Sulfopaludibacter sp.]
MLRRFSFSLLLASAAYAAAGGAETVDQATARLQELTAKVPAALRIEFRMRAAEALAQRHPDLARPLVALAVDEIKAGKNWQLGNGVLQSFAVAAPAEGVAIVPYLSAGSASMMPGALARANRLEQAVSLYRQSLARGDLQVQVAGMLLTPLVKEKPAEAAKLFQEMLSAVNFTTLDPYEAYQFLNCAKIVSPVAKKAAIDAVDAIVAAASAPDYGEKSSRQFTAVFQGGPEPVSTTNGRDTVLLASGIRLREIAPERFEARKAAFAKWNLSAPLSVKSIGLRRADAPAARRDGPDAAISKELGQMRGLPTDADRARLVLQVIREIRELPAASQVQWASSVANLSTEGDLGKEALGAVAATMASALREAPASTADPYLELASLVRFEHLPAPPSDPSLDAAASLVSLRQQLHQEIDFTLTGLDGKTYTLSALRGKVVLLNFWATWCPPCRKEMPDMEKLYRSLQAKGFVVLAVSDEDRETVARFEEKLKYTFPLLLDPDRKVNAAFDVEGIPKSFLFDRDGKLVAHAIDMRTEAQFLEMLKQAGM